MSSFDDLLIFPPIIEESTSGRESNTRIMADGGTESRNAKWSRRRWRVNIGGVKLTAEQANQFDDFCEVLDGALTSFLFRMDGKRFELNAEDIGTGNGVLTSFQLKRTRSYQGVTAAQPEIIQYPVHDYPDILFAGGAVALPTQTVQITLSAGTAPPFTVNRQTGVVTFDTAIPNTVHVLATCKYFIRVRFEGDFTPLQTKSGKFYEFGAGLTLLEPKGGV